MTEGKRILTFGFCGLAAATVNVTSRWFFSHILPYEMAILLAFGMGLLTGFLLFRGFVFGRSNTHSTVGEVIWYLVINSIALGQTLLVSLVLARWLLPRLGFIAHAEDIAHIVGVAVPVVTSYFGHKYLTFGKKGGIHA